MKAGKNGAHFFVQNDERAGEGITSGVSTRPGYLYG